MVPSSIRAIGFAAMPFMIISDKLRASGRCRKRRQAKETPAILQASSLEDCADKPYGKTVIAGMAGNPSFSFLWESVRPVQGFACRGGKAG